MVFYMGLDSSIVPFNERIFIVGCSKVVSSQNPEYPLKLATEPLDNWNIRSTWLRNRSTSGKSAQVGHRTAQHLGNPLKLATEPLNILEIRSTWPRNRSRS